MQTAMGWLETKLGAIATIERRAVSPATIAPQATYVGLEHIAGDGAIASRTVEAGELRSSKFAFSERHVLYGKLRPYLRKIARPGTAGICSTDILPILPGPDLDRDYLFHWLRQPRIVSLATLRSDGVNLPRVSPTTLLELPFSLPPLDKQRRTAAMLDRADAVQRKQRERMRLLNEFLRSAFLEMFGDPVRNEKGWELIRLADCLLEKPVIGTITPATEPGEFSVIRVGELGEYDVAIDRAGRVSVPGKDLSRFEAREGDLLLARAIGSEQHLGKASVMQRVPQRILFDSHVMRLRPNPERTRGSFLWHLFQTSGGRRLLLKHGGRTAVQFNINASQVADARIPLPPLEEQERFLSLAARARTLQLKQIAAGVTTDTLFDLVGRLAFRGELSGS